MMLRISPGHHRVPASMVNHTTITKSIRQRDFIINEDRMSCKPIQMRPCQVSYLWTPPTADNEQYSRRVSDNKMWRNSTFVQQYRQSLTALSSWRIIASNSSCPRRHRRRVPEMQLDKLRLLSWTFWQSSADGVWIFSIPTLSRLSWTNRDKHAHCNTIIARSSATAESARI